MAGFFETLDNLNKRVLAEEGTTDPWRPGTYMARPTGQPAINTVMADEVKKDVESKIIKSGQDPQKATINAVNNPGIFDNLLKGTMDFFGGIGGSLGNIPGQALQFAQKNPDFLSTLGAYAYGKTLGSEMPAIGSEMGGVLAASGAAKTISERKKQENEQMMELLKLQATKDKNNNKDLKPLPFEAVAKHTNTVNALRQLDTNVMPLTQDKKGIEYLRSVWNPGKFVDKATQTEMANLKTSYMNSAEALIRAESGAAVPDSEIKRLAQRFEPKPWDSDETIKKKINSLYSRSAEQIASTRALYDTGEVNPYIPKNYEKVYSEESARETALANKPGRNTVVAAEKPVVKMNVNSIIKQLQDKGATAEEIAIVKKQYGVK